MLERSDSADRLRALVDANLLVTPGTPTGRRSAFTRCSARCCMRSSGARAPRRSARCTGAPPQSSASARTGSAPSATRSPRATTATPPTSSGRSRRRWSAADVGRRSIAGAAGSATRPSQRIRRSPSVADGSRWRPARRRRHPSTRRSSSHRPGRSRSPTGPRSGRWDCSCAPPSACRATPRQPRTRRRRSRRCATDYPLRGIGLLVLGSLALLEREGERAQELLEEAKRLAIGTVPTLYALVLGQLALLAIDGGRWDEADTFVVKARTAAARSGPARTTRRRPSCRRPRR